MNDRQQKNDTLNQQLAQRLKQSYAVVDKLESKLKSVLKAQSEPIAIIGMGCRFPGGVNSPESFWRLLENETDAISEVPKSRWNIDNYNGSSAPDGARINSRYGGFIDDVDEFDAAFFEISPREARSLDPQQRLLLEVVWEALEEGNQLPDNLYGSNTGVFLAMSGSDYMLTQAKYVGEDQIDAYFGVGNAHATACGRISYTLGLQGPCSSVDTACSSSLVAIHNACASLRNGESDAAIVAAANLNLTPDINITFSAAHMLAEDGRCKTFDQAADGYVRGEGVAAVVLKRLSDALKDGDSIHALIRGSALNQDGPSSGLTVPNGVAQQDVIRRALRNAGLSPGAVSYVEAHGTGTSLGDPIEVAALNAVYGAERERRNPLLIGSVKTNIGHTEAAAGLAGLLKLVLSLKNQNLPRHLHCANPSNLIPWQDYPIRVVTDSRSWDGEPERIAGLSSFGFGGTNGHLIVSEAPAQTLTPADTENRSPVPERPCHIVKLSAKSAAALPALGRRYKEFLSAAGEIFLTDFAFTANCARTDHVFRMTVSATDRRELLDKLEQIGAAPSSQFSACEEDPPLAMLFAGQGSQYGGMGAQLYATQPVFKAVIDECESLLAEHMDLPLRELLWGDSQQQLHNTRYTQPALFALEYGLAKLWQSWGVEPAVVLGHSVGEYAAACFAGVFSLADGLKLIAARGRLMVEHCEPGAMAVVFAAPEKVQSLLNSALDSELNGELSTGWGDRLAIAALNGPENTVISGAGDALAELVAQLEPMGISSRPLTVSHGFHSPLMTPMLTAFREVAESITYQRPRLSVVSNLTGKAVTDELCKAAYWVEHVMAPVQFARGMGAVLDNDIEILLEVGPGNTLLGMGRQVLSARQGAAEKHWLASLGQGKEDWRVLLGSLGRLYELGQAVDWQAFDQPYPRQLLSLPSYPFQRNRYWYPNTETATGNATVTTALSELENRWLDVLRQDRVELLQEWLQNPSLTEADKTGFNKVLRALNQAHNGDKTPLDQYGYEMVWQGYPLPLLTGDGFTDHGVADRGFANRGFANRGFANQSPVLLVADRREDIAELEQALSAHGIDATIVLAGGQDDEVLPLEGDAFQFNLLCAKSWAIFFNRLPESKRDFQRCVFYRAPGNNDVTDVSFSLLRSAAAITQYTVNCKLVLVTRGATGIAHKNTGNEFDPAHACALGASRALAAELPENFLTTIDLDFNPAATLDRQAAELLCSLIGKASMEELVAIRAGEGYIPRLQRLTKPQKETAGPAISPEGSYLITGAFGGIGRALTDWLLSQGARHLVLVSRRKADSVALQALQQRWREAGAQLTIICADVADKSRLTAAYRAVADKLPPLMGVFHAAGISGDRIDSTSVEVDAFAQVLGPKVQGTLNLQALIEESNATETLNLFVNFSSIASVWGSAGQAAYCAANSFLDSFSQARRAQGYPVFSINWGPWREVGMGLELDADNQLARLGIQGFSNSQAISLLENALKHNCTGMVCADVDWERFAPIVFAKRRCGLLDELSVSASDESDTAQPVALMRQQLEQTPAARHPDMIMAFIEAQVRKVCQLDSQFAFEEKQGFTELGVDSLMAVELKNILHRELDLKLSSTLIFDYPTPAALVTYLATAIGEVLEGQVQLPEESFPINSAVGEKATREVADLSEEEAEALLLAKLNSL